MKSSKKPSRKTGAKKRPRPIRRRFRIVVTAGPTREYFDAVRFLSNPSSGKMGYAIAEAAAKAGHEVALISGPVAIAPPPNVKTIQVTTAAEMAAATKTAFRRADAAVLTAAVCDYRPKYRAKRKSAKTGRPKSVVLVPTEDIAAALGKNKGHRVTVAFAMETHGGRARAERKMLRKNCDAIVLNGPANVGSDQAAAEFLTQGSQWRRWPRVRKQALAARFLGELESLIAARVSRPNRS
ncbi:MAG: phosphopantothenoylcysteine decarboxylase [Planctomycetota bacterium]|nr:phosphopantothenoylcysteine decarboxylase [Planctomycetota bacterium]